MTIDKVMGYEMWSPDETKAPPHSHLYNLQPCGISTPLVEHFCSYLQRLAVEHNVFTRTLFLEEIAHRLAKEYTERQLTNLPYFLGRHNSVLNGMEVWTNDVVQVVAKLVQRKDLQELTLLPWHHLISPDRLQRRYKAWCPECFNKQRCTGQPVYEPLIWTLEVVKICPVHLRTLQTICPHPHCGKTVPALTSQTRVGYCSYCKGWLGDSRLPWQDDYVELSGKQLEWHQWIVNSVGEMIRSIPSLGVVRHPSLLVANIPKYLEKLTAGNVTQLARRLRISREDLKRWCNGSVPPTLKTLLTACFHLRTSPLGALLEDSVLRQVSQIKGNSLDLGPSSIIDQIEPTKAIKIRRELEQILESDDDQLPSVAEIAYRYGCTPATLYRHARELCLDITRRRQSFHKQIGIRASNKPPKVVDREELRQQLEAVLTSDEYPLPTVTIVASRLGYTPTTLYKHFPHLCRNISIRASESRPVAHKQPEGSTKNNPRQLDLVAMRQALEAALATEEYPPPTMREVSKRTGYAYELCYKYHAVLCYQIAARYLSFRKDQSRQREEELHREIRQTVITLHAQGIYPSLHKMSNALAKPGWLRIAKAKDVWKQALVDLGLHPRSKD